MPFIIDPGTFLGTENHASAAIGALQQYGTFGGSLSYFCIKIITPFYMDTFVCPYITRSKIFLRSLAISCKNEGNQTKGSADVLNLVKLGRSHRLDSTFLISFVCLLFQ